MDMETETTKVDRRSYSKKLLQCAINAVKDFLNVKELKYDNISHRVLLLAVLKRADNYSTVMEGIPDDVTEVLKGELDTTLLVFKDCIRPTIDFKRVDDRIIFLAILNTIPWAYGD